MAEQNPELKDIDVPSSTPTPETFDLADFIQEKSTTPVVGALVYLDAEGGRQLQEKLDRLAEIKDSLEEIESQPKLKLSIGETDPKAASAQKLNVEKVEVTEQADELTARVRGSALYVEFRCDDLKLPSIASKAASDELPGVEQAAVNDRAMTHMMAGLCIRMTTSDGRVNKGPFTVDQFQELRNKLIMVEGVKLIEAMNQSLMVGNEWASHIDAGFPGRNTHVAR